MKDIQIGYPTSFVAGNPIHIPDKFTLSKILGNIWGLNGDVTFGNVKFSAQRRYEECEEFVIGKVVNLHEEKLESIDIFFYDNTPLGNGEITNVIHEMKDLNFWELYNIVKEIMDNMDKFPNRDIRTDVKVL